jgi:formylglycine-generating enzyme required for sulfatase activity
LAGIREPIEVNRIEPFLIEGVTPEIRTQAALVLLRQGEMGRPIVEKALMNPDGQIRYAVAQALVDVGEEGRPIFLQALRNEDEQVRRLAAQAVRTIPEPTRGDVALDIYNARLRPEVTEPIFEILTQEADTSAETWRLRGMIDTRFSVKRKALDQIAKRGMDQEYLQQVRKEMNLKSIQDRTHFPERLMNLGYDSYVIEATRNLEIILPPLQEIPAGPFQMGSEKQKDSQANANEMPLHEVVTGNYQIGRYPVTVAEYACFIRATGHREPSESGGITWRKQLGRLDHPIVCVSWKDVIAYVAWLKEITGEDWRLPTEAEWEKAARGTDSRIYPWGDTWDKTKTNTSDGGPGRTTTVGSYPEGKSPYGCLDMAGNVWEWTSTLYRNYPYIYTDGREEINSTNNRVLRGGSWYVNSRNARVACRGNLHPVILGDDSGARLVRGVAG